MNEFARLPTRIPPRNDGAAFLRLATMNCAWASYFFGRAFGCFVRVAMARFTQWLFLAPVYWGELTLLLAVATIAFILCL